MSTAHLSPSTPRRWTGAAVIAVLVGLLLAHGILGSPPCNSGHAVSGGAAVISQASTGSAISDAVSTHAGQGAVAFDTCGVSRWDEHLIAPLRSQGDRFAIIALLLTLSAGAIAAWGNRARDADANTGVPKPTRRGKASALALVCVSRT